MRITCIATYLLRAILIASTVVMLLHSPAMATKSVFTRDYTYRASDADSKLSSRAIAMEQVKRILLEELGTYIKSETVIRNSDLTKDEITVLTAGVVSTDIIEEKWNGETYYIKVEIAADPDKIAQSIKELVAEKESLDDLKESSTQAKAALEEVKRLKAELDVTRTALEKARTQGKSTKVASKKAAELQRQYRTSAGKMTAIDLWNQAHVQFKKKKYKKAIKTLNRVIEINPKMARAYGLKGMALNRTKRYKSAVKSLNRAIELKPKKGKLYFARSMAYKKLGKHGKAKKDMRKSADLGFDKAKRKLRGGPRNF